VTTAPDNTPADAGKQDRMAATLAPRRVGTAKTSGSGRWIVTVKYSLFAAALALTVVVVLWPEFASDTVGVTLPRVSFGSDEFQLRMDDARYEGADNKNRPYVITAKSAVQNTEDKWLVDLNDLKADITMEDGTWIYISAAIGRYHHRRQDLDLRQGISLFIDNGYQLTTQAATVDLAAGRVIGTTAVQGHGPAGEVRANGFEAIDFGRVIRLLGDVRMIIRPRNEG